MKLYDNTHRWIFLMGFMDMLGVSMMIPMMLTQSKQLGASPVLTGFIGSVYGCLQLFSSPVIGSWSDSKGKKYVLCVCLLMSALAYFFTGLSNSLSLLITARIVAGLFKHTQTLGRAYLAEITPEDNEGKVFGRFMATSNIAFIIGPAIGGHLADFQHGFFYICTITSVTFLISFGFVWLKVPEVYGKEKKAGKKAAAADVLKVFRHLEEIDWNKHYDLMIGRLFFSFAVLVYRSNFSLIMNESLGFDAKTIGYVISYQGVVSATSGFVVGNVEKFYNHERIRLLRHAIVLMMLSLTGLVFSHAVFEVIVCLSFLCVSTSIIRVQYIELSVHRCEPDEVGAVIGVAQSMTSLSRMLSPVVAGFAQQLSLRGPGMVGVLSSAVGFVLTMTASSVVKPNLKIKS